MIEAEIQSRAWLTRACGGQAVNPPGAHYCITARGRKAGEPRDREFREGRPWEGSGDTAASLSGILWHPAVACAIQGAKSHPEGSSALQTRVNVAASSGQKNVLLENENLFSSPPHPSLTACANAILGTSEGQHLEQAKAP